MSSYGHETKLRYGCDNGRKPAVEGWWATSTCLDGIWSPKPQCIVINCGERPTVANGDVVEIGEMFLKYQCNSYYQLVGPEKVVCYSNGLWSEVPTCKANFCSVDTDRDPKFISDGVKFIGNGEKLRLECVETGFFPMYSDGVCTDGRISFSACCNRLQLRTGEC
ncbi:complement factor H-related protein 3-like [Gasterosteus aculeatus]